MWKTWLGLFMDLLSEFRAAIENREKVSCDVFLV
jgi:hypothetical protein